MRPMLINLHSYVLARLAARDVPWTQVGREAGIPYETLKKIASGRTPNPGVLHVQKLADYFDARSTGAQAGQQEPATAEALAVIRHVEAEAVATIKQVAQEILVQGAAAAAPQAEAPWDGVTERGAGPAAEPLTADPALDAELVRAAQAGLVKLPLQAKPWDGVERRVAQAPRRAVDRPNTDIAQVGRGA